MQKKWAITRMLKPEPEWLGSQRTPGLSASPVPAAAALTQLRGGSREPGSCPLTAGRAHPGFVGPGASTLEGLL